MPAVLADLSSIGEILTEAARWATSLGVVGAWPVPYPPEWIQGPLERGEVYLAYVGPEPVGTLTLQWSDPSVWGARAPDAGYVHKLASRRSPLGRGSGRAMLAWAAGEVQARDRPWLRLDTRSTHAGLRRYYLDLGFRIVGTSTVREMEVVLLERDSRAPWPFPPR